MRDIARTLIRGLAWTLTLCVLVCAFPAALGESGAVAAPVSASGAVNGMVRVRLSSIGSPSQVDVTVSGVYSVNGNASALLPSGSRVTVYFNASTGNLTLLSNGVSTGMGKDFRLYRHATSGESGVRIAQSRVSANLYPADLQFKAVSSGSGYKLYVIAHVYIEDYLYGVLPYEMGMSSPLEALKAQCVSARTYTLRAMQGAKDDVYDVVDTTTNQVYNGTPAGAERCKQAVNETRGIIAMNGAAFTATYYTASNGGQTEAILNIWGSSGYDYVSVRDDPYDLANSASQVRSFTVNKSGTQSNSVLASLLLSRAKIVFDTQNVTLTGVTAVIPHTPRYAPPSRLYTKLDFVVTAQADGTQRTGTLSFDIFGELENALSMSINSDNNELWSVRSTATGFTVQSRRFGHGTGLSQRGAMQMAALNYRYDEILAFYFPGCRQVPYSFISSVWSAPAAGGSTQQLTVNAPVSVSQSAACTGVVSLSSPGETLPLRAAPALSGDVLALIPHGAVTAVHLNADGWCLVTFGALHGYVQTSALRIAGTPDGASQAPTTLVSFGRVTNPTYLNLRSGATESAAVLAEVPSGTVLPLLSVQNNWAYTQYGRSAGYVSMSYIARLDAFSGTANDPEATGAEVIDNAGAPLRLSASTSGYVAQTLPRGSIVKVKYDDGVWTQAYYAGVTGYILSSALAKNNLTVDETDDTPAAGEQYAVVASNANTLNMRAAASLSAQIITEIPKGDTVIVMSKGTTWCQVRYHGVEGYCMTQYLQLTGSVTGGGETLTATVTTASGSLNLRKSQSTSSGKITQIPRLATVLVTQRGAEWCQVTYGTYSGYVMTKFLTFGTLPAQTQTPVVTPGPVVTATPDPRVPVSARVTTVQGSLNLREQPKSGARILKTIPQNAVIPVTSVQGTWTQVSYNSTSGYVMSVFLTYIYTQTPATAIPPVVILPTAAPTVYTYARVTTVQGSLNLREKARSGANILTTIPQNTVITVLEQLGTWTHVEYGGKTGYVMTTFLTFVTAAGTATPAPTASASSLWAQVTTVRGSLNLRAEARSGAKILTTIPQYTMIEVYNRASDWSRVSYDGETGFVMSSFLTFMDSSVIPSAAPTLPAGNTWARVTTQEGSLNLRKDGRSGARVLCTIPQYAVIEVLSPGAVWSRVTYDGETGYVKNEFLTFLNATDAPPAQGTPTPPAQTPAAPSVPVTGGTGNDARDATLVTLSVLEVAQVLPAEASTAIRRGCANDADAVALVLRGDYVVVTAKGSTWCEVSYEGKAGYLPAALLKFN